MVRELLSVSVDSNPRPSTLTLAHIDDVEGSGMLARIGRHTYLALQ